jgi:prolyl-tRNA synthetase
MPVVTTDGTLVLALVRGDDKLAEEKLMGELQSDFRPATDEEIRAGFGAGGGSLGPTGFEGPIVADEALREGQFVAGANRDGFHLRGVEAGRDYKARFADIRETKPDDRCPRCGGALRVQTAIELGHIFKLGTRYSVPFGATFLDESGTEQPIIMGSYGIGPGRVMAAIVEQHHEDGSIVWPSEVAPYQAHVVALPGAESIAEEAAEALAAAGLEVLLDDRDLRAGEKFADADLIGSPIRVTAGRKSLEDGKVDFRLRTTGEERRLFVADLGKEVGDR